MEDEPGQLECYQNVTKSVVLIFGGIVMSVGSYLATGHSQIDRIIMGWIGVALFGSCVIIATYRLFKRGPVIIIDEVGIEDVRTDVGIIPWEEITSILVKRVNLISFITIEVTDEKKLFSIIPWYKKPGIWINGILLGMSPFIINPFGLSHSLDEIIDFISDCDYLTTVDIDDESWPDGVVLVNPLHTHEISE